MAVTVIDSKGELAEYIGQTAPEEPDKKAAEAPAPANGADPAAKASDAVEKPEVEDPDDVEGDDGLTARQKRELSAKMLKAIGKKHREMKEAEEFAAAQYSEKRLAEARAAALEEENRRLKGAQPVPRETADPEAGKPKREDFQTDQAYWDAHIGWLAKKEAVKMLAEARAQDAKAAAERQFAEAEAAAKERVDRAIVVVPDFVEKVGTKDIMIPGDMNDPETAAGYVRQSPMIAELLYYFSEHPAEAKKLADMPRSIQLVTIGKIEGTLKPFEPKGSKTTNGATPSKTATNGHASAEDDEPSETGSTPSRARGTAPVITPLTSTSALQVEKDPGDMTTRERITTWQKQHKVQLIGLRKRH